MTVTKQRKKGMKYAILAAIMVACAVICRIMGKIDCHLIFFSLMRSLIYIGLYIGWGITVSRRVVHKAVLNCLVSVSCLTVFWFVVRTMKYFFVVEPVAARQLWYWYYLPMLFIPLLSVFVAMSLGQPENFRLPKWTALLYIPTALCLVLVLTNDWHQLVFSFPAGEVWTDGNNSYEPGYYIVVVWAITCALTAFIMMVFKCRLSHRKKYLPGIVILLSVVYVIIYVSGAEWMQIIGGDITAALCLMFTLILESCIQCGLIQTNTGYEALFEIGTIKAQITDRDYLTQYASSNAMIISKGLMRAAENGKIKLDKNTLLGSSPISGGHVLWQEDISDIAALLERLAENRKTISENNYLERENYKTEKKINTIRERNRLYDLLQSQTARQIRLLNRLLTEYEEETDAHRRRSLLAKTAVIGVYIKRRGNLMLIGERTQVTDTAELSACLDESFAALELMGVACAADIPGKNKIYVEDAVRMYGFFETVMEAAIDDIRSVWIKGRICEDEVIFSMETETETELWELAGAADFCDSEDGVWHFTIRTEKAGKQL